MYLSRNVKFYFEPPGARKWGVAFNYRNDYLKIEKIEKSKNTKIENRKNRSRKIERSAFSLHCLFIRTPSTSYQADGVSHKGDTPKEPWSESTSVRLKNNMGRYQNGVCNQSPINSSIWRPTAHRKRLPWQECEQSKKWTENVYLRSFWNASKPLNDEKCSKNHVSDTILDRSRPCNDQKCFKNSVF